MDWLLEDIVSRGLFDRNFDRNEVPLREGQALAGSRPEVEAWLRLFTAWYNWVRPNQTLGTPPSQRGLS